MFKFIKSLFAKKCTCKRCTCGQFEAPTELYKPLEVSYSPFNFPLSGSTAIQGVRGINGTDDVYVSGSVAFDKTDVQGVIYKGPLSHNGSLGNWYTFTFKNELVNDTYNTSIYGPCDLGNGNIRFVGSYKTTTTGQSAMGMLYQGPLDGTGTYTTIAPNRGLTKNVYVHSTMGDLAVGNYDTALINGFAFIYDIKKYTYVDFKVPDALTTTLYGIWHNGGESYTLVGGFTKAELGEFSRAFICDYDRVTGTVTNFTPIVGMNQVIKSFITHFEGINASCTGYDLAAGFGNIDGGGASYVQIGRKQSGDFTLTKWTDLKYPDNAVKVTTSDTVYKKNILGVILSKDGIGAYLAKLNK
jgi:hypothetical protein